jgi:hypothetical protein
MDWYPYDAEYEQKVAQIINPHKAESARRQQDIWGKTT